MEVMVYIEGGGGDGGDVLGRGRWRVELRSCRGR